MASDKWTVTNQIKSDLSFSNFRNVKTICVLLCGALSANTWLVMEFKTRNKVLGEYRPPPSR